MLKYFFCHYACIIASLIVWHITYYSLWRHLTCWLRFTSKCSHVCLSSSVFQSKLVIYRKLSVFQNCYHISFSLSSWPSSRTPRHPNTLWRAGYLSQLLGLAQQHPHHRVPSQVLKRATLYMYIACDHKNLRYYPFKSQQHVSLLR